MLIRSAAMTSRSRTPKPRGLRLVAVCALSLASAPVRAQPAPAPRPPGSRPVLVVSSDGHDGQRLQPLPGSDATPLGGSALALRGIRHEYALTNTTVELSPDGTLLAFERGGRPFVRHLPSGVEIPLVRGRIRDVDCRFVGFAPDSRRIAYTLNASQQMEGPPSIFPVPAGVYVATLRLQGPPEGARSPAPVLSVVSNTRLPGARTDDSVSFWSDDGAALLGRARSSDYVEALVRRPVDGGRATTLQSVRAYLGMIQLHARGGLAVFQYTALTPNNRPASTSLAALPIAPGTAPTQPRTLVPLRLVAYTDLDAQRAMHLYVVPVDGSGAPRALHDCRFTCDARWESPTTLLLANGGALLRLRVDGGAAETLVPDGVDAVLVGGGP